MANAAPNPTLQAVRIATACTLCLVLVAWWRLEHANLAVWTSYMIMAVVPVTVFQRGFERVLGRAIGIVAAVGLVALFPDQILARTLLTFGVLLAVFYCWVAGRLAYAVFNGALYFITLVNLSEQEPRRVTHEGWAMFLAVLVGCVVSDLVIWVTRGEATFHIEPGGQPLFPLRNDWLNRALMMIVTAFVTLRVCMILGLPLGPTAISLMVMTGNPDVHSMLVKGEMRLGGVVAGGAYAAFVFFILALVPYFSVLVALVFLGTFVAGYLAKVLGAYAYFGAQLGLVICLSVIVPPNEFGSLAPAVQRLVGILIGIAAVVVVPGLWPYLPFDASTGSTATPPGGAKPA